MSRFWSPQIHQLAPYVPGEQPKMANLVKLNTNENPYGPSPAVLEAIQEATTDSLRLYPDPDATRLKSAIASYYQIQPQQVFPGNGSDEVLAHIFMAFFRQAKPLLFPDITYSFYPVYCGLYGIDYRTVALDEKFGIDLDAFDTDNGGIIFPNPNAPTGCLLSLDSLRGLLQRNTETVVVIDEAYVDFGGESAIALIDDFPNLLVTQSFSKSRSLAGLRIGFAAGHPDLIEALVRVKDSFNSYPLDTIAIAAGVAALQDRSYFDETRKKVMESRESMAAELATMGFKVLPSAANFLFATHPEHDAAGIAQGLRDQGIIVRHFSKPRIQQFLRISIGTPAENATLLKVIATLVR